MEDRAARIGFEEEQLEGNITLLMITGDLDMYTLPKAKNTINHITETGRNRILIDLKNMDYIDSSGLGFFIGTLKKLKEKGGDLKLMNLNSYIQGIFKLINLNYIIEIFEDRETAIKHFNNPDE
ncbi:MAG: STAS domain-containing protein [bacterium]|nr:STAS domain-containing protein [bacterium]